MKYCYPAKRTVYRYKYIYSFVNCWKFFALIIIMTIRGKDKGRCWILRRVARRVTSHMGLSTIISVYRQSLGRPGQLCIHGSRPICRMHYIVDATIVHGWIVLSTLRCRCNCRRPCLTSSVAWLRLNLSLMSLRGANTLSSRSRCTSTRALPVRRTSVRLSYLFNTGS